MAPFVTLRPVWKHLHYLFRLTLYFVSHLYVCSLLLKFGWTPHTFGKWHPCHACHMEDHQHWAHITSSDHNRPQHKYPNHMINLAHEGVRYFTPSANAIPALSTSVLSYQRTVHIVTAFVRSYYRHELEWTREACARLFACTVLLTAASVNSFPLSLPLIFIIATLSQMQRYQYLFFHQAILARKYVPVCVCLCNHKLYCLFSLTGSVLFCQSVSSVAAMTKVMIQQETVSV